MQVYICLGAYCLFWWLAGIALTVVLTSSLTGEDSVQSHWTPSDPINAVKGMQSNWMVRPLQTDHAKKWGAVSHSWMQLQERKATAASLKSSLPCQHPISNKLETCYMLKVVEKVMSQYFNILKHWCFSWCSPFYFSWLWCLFLFVPSMLLACWVYSISSYYNGCSGSIQPWKPTSRKFIIKLSATVLSVKMSHMHMPKISFSI